jgi:Nucleotidyl transferase of unknown function (DUF2204)
MHKDFKDLLSAFNARNVRYMIVGGYAYARYTEPRTTKDLDLFVRPDPENAPSVFQALAEYGTPLADTTVADLAKPSTVIQIGVPPFRIDVLFNIDGLTFDQAWETAEPAFVDEIPVRYISCENLIVNKLAVARPQDLVDVDKLRHARETRRRHSAESARQ